MALPPVPFTVGSTAHHYTDRIIFSDNTGPRRCPTSTVADHPPWPVHLRHPRITVFDGVLVRRAASATLVKPSILKKAFKALTPTPPSSASEITTARSTIP
ncbi:hypothetical protein U1Q18_049678, partial [Sarracenia purpurea var. burkii]